MFEFFESLIYDLISERIARNLRYDLYHSLINKDVEFFDSRKTGDLCKYNSLNNSNSKSAFFRYRSHTKWVVNKCCNVYSSCHICSGLFHFSFHYFLGIDSNNNRVNFTSSNILYLLRKLNEKSLKNCLRQESSNINSSRRKLFKHPYRQSIR